MKLNLLKNLNQKPLNAILVLETRCNLQIQHNYYIFTSADEDCSFHGDLEKQSLLKVFKMIPFLNKKQI
ncbi:hypothetical protein SAMN06265350_11147 [Solitalea koreensis]|uniref:Uncharacterized protein n=1 Tax=Solitalea koreensis TaxID=543615 RepID=A0A521E5B1_9SPHI|nr:hypothetical protein SAMN06265350_11147 [Solitalea koreensis]